MSVSSMPLRAMPSRAARRMLLPACASCSSLRRVLPALPPVRMRLPGSAGLLSVLGIAGPVTTFWALYFMALPVLVMLFSTTLLVIITRWNWLPCYGHLCGW